jgi:hypothetical protein
MARSFAPLSSHASSSAVPGEGASKHQLTMNWPGGFASAGLRERDSLN